MKDSEKVKEKLDAFLGLKTSSTQVERIEQAAAKEKGRRTKSDMARILIDEALDARAGRPA